jgi:VWFA-related protein
VNTRLVQVDVVVRAKNGPVADLRREDFTIWDNGKVQRIGVFSVSDARPSKSQQVAPLPPGVVSNRMESGGEAATTATVILFDLLNTPIDEQPYAIGQLLEYVRSIRKEDHVALYILDNQLRIVQDFTGDTAKLSRAAARIKPSDVSGSETRSAAELAELLTDPDGLIGPEFANGVVAFYATNQAQRTAEAIEAIARHLGGLPGRKNLVWMSGDFPFAPEFAAVNQAGTRAHTTEDPLFLTSQVSRAVRSVSDANIGIYPVDVRALPAPDMRTVRAKAPLPPLPDHDAMLRLAGGSGGRAFYYTNDLKGAVSEAVADGEVTYTIGFYPAENAFDGKFHRLSIDVARKNVDVRYRSGYAAVDTQAMTETQRRALLADLVSTSLNASQIELAAHAEGQRAVISVNAADVRLEQQNNRRVGLLIVALRLESQKSSTDKISNIRINISEDQYRAALQNGLVFDEAVPGVQPDDRLRIVVQDEATGLAGSLWLPMPSR